METADTPSIWISLWDRFWAARKTGIKNITRKHDNITTQICTQNSNIKIHSYTRINTQSISVQTVINIFQGVSQTIKTEPSMNGRKRNVEIFHLYSVYHS